jgi:hypothetical protein
MGWKSGLVGLALAAGAAAAADAQAAPGASFGTLDGRDYVLMWPGGTPDALMIYLHAESAEPLGVEAGVGMLEALAADASVRGYAMLAPAAGRNACGREDSDAAPRACWRLDAVGDELARIDRLVGFIERNHGTRFTTRAVVGYERGAALVVTALREGRLSGYAKVGLLDAPERPLLGAELGPGPIVYVHAGEGEAESASRAAELLRALVAAGYGAKTCAMGDAGGRIYDGRRMAGFLVWFARDCRRAEPAPAPPLPGAAAASAEDDEEAAASNGRRGRGGPRR